MTTVNIILPLYVPTDFYLEMTRKCIDSMFSMTRHPFRLFIVASECSSQALEYLQTLHDSRPSSCLSVTVIIEEKRNGFIRGMNAGLREAAKMDGDFLLTQNDATYYQNPLARGEPCWLQRLHDTAYKDGNIGVVGDDGAYHGNNEYNFDTQWVGTWCFYLKRAAFDRIGPFDERYNPAYWDDIDYCRAVLNAGMGVVSTGTTCVRHIANQTNEKFMDAEKLKNEHRLKFMEKWGKKE